MKSSFFIVFFLLVYCCTSGLAIYFAQPDNLSLSLGFWPEDQTIHVVRCILETDDSGHIIYSISPATQNVKCHELSINPDSGFISVLPLSNRKLNGGNGKEEDTECIYKVVGELKGKPGSRNVPKDEITLRLNIPSVLPSMTDVDEQCSQLTAETLCFEGVDIFQISVMENNPSISVANLGYLNQICRRFHVNYTINSEVLTMDQEDGSTPFSIWTHPSLDRELKATHNFFLSCQLTSKDTAETQDFMIPGKLTVLDQNDNEIESQNGSKEITVFVSFSTDGNKFEPKARLNPAEHGDLLAKDSDTTEVNNFSMTSINDTKGLLEFDIQSVKFTNSDNISSSIIFPKIKLSEKVKETSPWTGYYCVAADLHDASIQIFLHPPMRYTICLRWGQHEPYPKVSMEELDSKLNNGVFVGTLSRWANTQAAVMYPFPDLVTDISQLVSGIQFYIKSVHAFDHANKTTKIRPTKSSKDSVEHFTFAVTKRSGIIYLVDSSYMKNESIKGFHIQISCNSTFKSYSNVNLTVFLEESTVNTTLNCKEENCAEISDENTCETSCGFGSIGNCLWRNKSSVGKDNKSPRYGPYATCSSNLGTCPDGKCDELESDYPSICPQDCAKEINGLGRLRTHANGIKYGVKECIGVCTCHGSSSCSCAPIPTSIILYKEEPLVNGNNSFPNKNLRYDEANLSGRSNSQQPVSFKPFNQMGVLETAGPHCGKTCIAVYSSVSVTVTIVLISIFVIACRRKAKKKSTQSVVVDASDLEMSGGYGDRRGNRILMTDTSYFGSGLTANNSNGFLPTNANYNNESFFQVESKWEIPREDLLLDHVLGEGEFGRVLKGVLRSVTGPVHVAVKMLKVDHADENKSLRQEFMAEFSLLKQLDHPNVIKLLGACTSQGGPPYLVMEYAEFGSLRSFLRKCRRVEKIHHSCTPEWCEPERRPHKRSSTDVQDFEYVVTPQEVLGFSWQIAKGMAYLSDMKMVHRDLAARNILVTKTKVCKISDFGLTRDIYVDDAYRKKSKDRVPVKWLAPECLTDELYTSKSDVWAFGILLWELTTLGASPYPGIQTELLYSLLDSGYRMQQPVNCSNEVYSIMRKCWGKVPIDRPTFHELVYELSRLLENGIEYLKLDIPSVSNPGYDIFIQESSTEPTMISDRPVRRNSSMENLRLIDYEISTNDDFNANQAMSHNIRKKHTYINNPSGSQDCESGDDHLNSSGYESPITLSTG